MVNYVIEYCFLLCTVTGSLKAFESKTEEIHDTVKYFIVNQEFATEPMQLTPNNLQHVNHSKPTKMIIHGYLNSATSKWVVEMSNEYLKKDNYNIIHVDWSQLSFKSYLNIVSYANEVGTGVGEFITDLHKNHSLNLNNLHVIGHSVGSHIAGIASKYVQSRTNGAKVGRITALDATGFLFEESEPHFISETDAQVVDAIHTDSCQFGFQKPVGTVDFYPNGGTALQPSCQACPRKPSMTNVFHIKKIIACVTCSHLIGINFFIQTINKEKLIGTKCSSWNEYRSGNCNNNLKSPMGEGYVYMPKAIGKFYLDIIPSRPFVLNI